MGSRLAFFGLEKAEGKCHGCLGKMPISSRTAATVAELVVVVNRWWW